MPQRFGQNPLQQQFGAVGPGANPFSGGSYNPMLNEGSSQWIGGPTGSVGGQGVMGAGGMDKVTLAMLLMNALGTGFQAYSQGQQQKKDRDFRRQKYDELAGVRAKGREGLLAPQEQHQVQNNDFFNTGEMLPGNVAAPPPPGPSAQGDDELQRILRARLGGSYR